MPGDPTTWAYTATLASQDGFPAAGVLRIRDVEAEATQWRLGGATGNTNATRLLDVLIPDGAAPDQMTALSNYPPSQGDLDSLGPDDFAQLPMLRVE
jgi:carbohydrate-binding DOMON domain-containing protein